MKDEYTREQWGTWLQNSRIEDLTCSGWIFSGKTAMAAAPPVALSTAGARGCLSLWFSACSDDISLPHRLLLSRSPSMQSPEFLCGSPATPECCRAEISPSRNGYALRWWGSQGRETVVAGLPCCSPLRRPPWTSHQPFEEETMSAGDGVCFPFHAHEFELGKTGPSSFSSIKCNQALDTSYLIKLSYQELQISPPFHSYYYY